MITIIKQCQPHSPFIHSPLSLLNGTALMDLEKNTGLARFWNIERAKVIVAPRDKLFYSGNTP